MGCGAIFYEGHITRLGERGKVAEQEHLYDDMFSKVHTDYLQLMIRHDHEPQNDNDDPYDAKFKDEWFAYAKKTVAICEAAKKRNPQIQLYATLYTPPPWMKTNHEVSAGGQAKGTIIPGMELEVGEFCWAFLDYMHRHGQDIKYLSIANEPDWPHTQPGYFLTPEQHVDLFLKLAAYFAEMARRHPEVPKPRLVGPNNCSAVACGEKWLKPLLEKAGNFVDVVGTHDYDRRGDRWRKLRQIAGSRPLWLTEWCVNGPDNSPDLIHSASQYWLAMTEAFNGGANVWMAYDWVYPPRQGGEALIHQGWNEDYHLTKIYHGFRQWCLPLRPGMKIVKTDLTGPAATGISKPGLKASAFISADGKQLVIHAAAVQDTNIPIRIELSGPLSSLPVQRYRTSRTEDMALLEPITFHEGSLTETLPAGSMMTWLIGFPIASGGTSSR